MKRAFVDIFPNLITKKSWSGGGNGFYDLLMDAIREMNLIGQIGCSVCNSCSEFMYGSVWEAF